MCFLFKQKTAYEMRICDWSSDVCSSDLHDLTREHFDRVIDAREADLQDETPASVGELEGYCESTAAPLLYLCLEILGVRDGPAYAAARHLGVAWALVGIARAVPFHARQRRILLPVDLTESEGADRGDILELQIGRAHV